MVKRTLTGIIMLAVVLLVLWLDSFSHFVLDALILFLGVCASFEMIKALKNAKTEIDEKEGYNVSKLSIYLSCAIVYPLSYFFGYTGLFLTFIISSLVAFIIYIFDSNRTFVDFTTNIFAILYPLLMVGILFVIHKNYGIVPVLLAGGISAASDVTAYFVGATIGKRKIFPKISPKKTYAGCIGGLFGGAIGGIVVYLVFELGRYPSNITFVFSDITSLPILLYACVGFVVAFFSEIGDLAASRIKREVGIKDYGTALGSHGGFLDRIDSILFTSVCMAIIMQIIEVSVL